MSSIFSRVLETRVAGLYPIFITRNTQAIHFVSPALPYYGTRNTPHARPELREPTRPISLFQQRWAFKTSVPMKSIVSWRFSRH